MNNEQIAHDLAVAKLIGSDLSPEEMLKLYSEYKKAFLDLMKEEPKTAEYYTPQI